jgi:SpoVK/Ycf46/Vps4 family AAA+-type ATPase
MNIVTVTVEVNQYWLQEHSKDGQDAFGKVKEMLQKTVPGLKVTSKGCKLEIISFDTTQSFQIRSAVKKYLTDEYKMSIEEGDYRLTAKTSIVPDSTEKPAAASAEAEPEETPEEPAAEESEDTSDDSEEKSASSASTGTPAFRVVSGASDAPRPSKPDTENRPKGYNVIMPELDSFIEELDTVVRNGKKFKVMESVWSTTILLSMDSGHGISTVTGQIVRVLENNGITFNSVSHKAVTEVVIPEDPQEAERAWDKLFESTKMYAKDSSDRYVGSGRKTSDPLAFLVDISACLGEVEKKEFYENIKKLSENRGDYLLIFRVPYIEENALRKLEQVLTDVFVVRELVIPPLSNEQLLIYLKYCLTQRGVQLEGDLDEALEKLIAFEKKDGRFYGLKTIRRLTDDIVYKLLLREGSRDGLSLDEETLMDIYVSVKENDVDPEVLLSELCGMDNVKQTIDGIVAQIKLYKELKSSGKKLSAPTMHMRFVGSPGTGKTTVARLVAQIFKKNGILNKGYFYEIKARDLCGRYVGETAPKTSAYCRDALGSVLFIDEAYTLFRDNGSRADYGREAIDTLITEMENNRDNLVVIMAGYKNEMDDLMKANSGLESRMPYEITFRNYTKDELVEIFFSMVGEDFSYTDGFDHAIREFIQSIPDNVVKSAEFSNARMIRNLYERIWSKVAFRRQNSENEELILTEDDVNRAIADDEFRQLLNIKTKTIGF